MQTLTYSTRSRYTLTPTRDVGAFRAKLDKCNGKHKRAPIRVDSRAYPRFVPGESTADYVRAYEALNGCRNLHALQWQNLNEAPCALYSGEDSHQTLPDQFATWEDFDAAQIAAPDLLDSAQPAANDSGAPVDPGPAAPGGIVAAPSFDDLTDAQRAALAAAPICSAWNPPAEMASDAAPAAEVAPIDAAEVARIVELWRDKPGAADELRARAANMRAGNDRGAGWTYPGHAQRVAMSEERAAIYCAAADAIEQRAPDPAPVKESPYPSFCPVRAAVYRAHLATAATARAIDGYGADNPAPAGAWDDRIGINRLRARGADRPTGAQALRDRVAAAVRADRAARRAVPMASPGYAFSDPLATHSETAESGPEWLARILRENRAKREDCEARARSVAQFDSVPFKHADGERYGIAGPCMSEPGRFRFSYFDARGAIGHCTRDTLALAMWEALDLGYRYATENADPAPLAADTDVSEPPAPATHSAMAAEPGPGAELAPEVAAMVAECRARVDGDPRPKRGIELQATACRKRADGMRQGIANREAAADILQAWAINGPRNAAAADALEAIAAAMPDPPAPILEHSGHDWETWRAIGRGDAEPDAYSAHVLECYGAARAQLEAAGRYPYNADAWPLAAAMMAERHGYPDARVAGASDGVARAFGSNCYSAGEVIRAREKAAAEKAAAAGLRAGQKFARLIFSDGKLCTGAVLESFTHTGAECRLTGKRAGRPVDINCTATSLLRAAERAAERSALHAQQRKRAKPAPVTPPATHAVADPEPVPTHSDADAAGQVRTVPADPYASDTHERPCAAPGLTSYRARGVWGWIMIGATDDADAMREAKRSTHAPTNLQRWNGSAYVPCNPEPLHPATHSDPVPSADPLPVESAPAQPVGATIAAEYRATAQHFRDRANSEQEHAPTFERMAERFEDMAHAADPPPADTGPAAQPVPGDSAPVARLEHSMRIVQTLLDAMRRATPGIAPTASALRSEAARVQRTGEEMRTGAPQYAADCRMAASGLRDLAEHAEATRAATGAAIIAQDLTLDEASSLCAHVDGGGAIDAWVKPGGPADIVPPCRHPPARLYCGHAMNADGIVRPWVACCDCGDVLAGGATREPDPVPEESADGDDTAPAPLDGLDVADLGADGLAEFERAGGTLPEPTAPAYSDAQRPPGPSLRIPAPPGYAFRYPGRYGGRMSRQSGRGYSATARAAFAGCDPGPGASGQEN